MIGCEKELNLCGIEIKGDTDNFTRLKSQLNDYLFCFNEVYIALHKKEAPEWLPSEIGIIRVFDNGDTFIEKYSHCRDLLEVSTDYEWDALFRANGLGITSQRTRNVLGTLKDTRRIVLFNRFFGIQDGFNTKKMAHFYPFTEAQKTVIIGFDVPHHFKNFKRELSNLEKRMNMIKEAIALGQTGLKDF